MTRIILRVSLAIVSILVLALPAWTQTAQISGTVTDNDKPLAGVQVIYKSTSSIRQIKTKTDSKGNFFAIGVPLGTYDVSVLDATGKIIYTHNNLTVAQGGSDTENILNIDITKGVTAKTPGGGSVGGGGIGPNTSEFHGPDPRGGLKTGTVNEGSSVSKEDQEKYQAQKAKVENINSLIAKYQAAANAKNWAAAIPVLQGMVEADPSHWEYLKALGEAQFNTGDYENSVQSFQKAIPMAEGYVSGSTPKDSKNPYTEPAKAKTGMGQMYATEGNAYLNLKKNPEAIDAFTKAAELDPSSAGATYYNVCATQYNIGNMDAASAICDKAIQADPNRPDSYFIKGAAMYGNGKMDANNKYIVPPGTAEALQKYLELAPDGKHAADVKAMLDALGVPIEVNYKGRKKK
jgi:tetratricopeptide (TPR) repeat protein